MIVRDYLAKLRKEAGLTVRDMGARINLTSGGYTLIETGQRQCDMSFSMMDRLANALGVTFDDIARMEREYRENRESESA